MIRAQQAPTLKTTPGAPQPAMTAFASHLVAGQTGPGAPSGAGKADVRRSGGIAGVFQALVASVIDGGKPGSEAATVAMSAAAPTAAGDPARLGSAPDAPAADDDVSLTDQAAGELLAAAEAVAAAPPFADAATVDAAETASTSGPFSAAGPIEGLAGLRLDPEFSAQSPLDAAPVADEAGSGSSPSDLAAVDDHGSAPIVPSPEPAAAPAQTAGSGARPLVQAAPELTSLIGRIVESAKPEQRPDPGDADQTAETDPAVTTLEAPIPATPAPSTRRSARADVRAGNGRAEAMGGLASHLTASADKAVPVGSSVAAEVDEIPSAALQSLPGKVEAQADAAAPEPAPIASAAPAQTQAGTPSADPAAVVRGSPETVARLASDIIRKLEGKTTRFDVQLDPLGLGKVDVSIEINADGRLSAALTFDSAQAAADLRGRATELRQALEKAGFELTDASLSFDTGAQSGGFGGREPGEQFADWSRRAFRSAQSGLDQADVQLAAAALARTPTGGVDIRI